MFAKVSSLQMVNVCLKYERVDGQTKSNMPQFFSKFGKSNL